MISMIQLKQVLRNRRFVLFTILLPLAWYMFLYNIQADMLPNIMLGIAVFIGIIGNSLATFSKRISSDIGFYSFESRFSNYGIKNYLLDQTFVQIVLNTLIFVVVLCVAAVFAKFPINGKLGIQFFLIDRHGHLLQYYRLCTWGEIGCQTHRYSGISGHYSGSFDHYALRKLRSGKRIYFPCCQSTKDFPGLLLHEYDECNLVRKWNSAKGYAALYGKLCTEYHSSVLPCSQGKIQ